MNLPIRCQLDKHFSGCESSVFPPHEHHISSRKHYILKLLSNLPAIFPIFHIHVLNHQEARVPLFTSSLTSVVSSKADSIIHHQLSQRNPKPVSCWHILIQDANTKRIWQCKFWNPPPPSPQICCCCYLEHKAVYTLIFSRIIVSLPAELNITHQHCLKLLSMHQGLQSA